MSDTPTKTLRADARRNRDKLLVTALVLFSERGPDVSMDAVAKAAGVGAGTLYRHFPTREALIEAAYLSELARLEEAVGELLAEHPPDVALEHWMEQFVTYAQTKRGMAAALQSVVATGGDPFCQARDRILAAVTEMVEAGQAAAVLRDDVGAEDVFRGMGGIFAMPDEPEWADRARTLLRLLMDGLRHRPARTREP